MKIFIKYLIFGAVLNGCVTIDNSKTQSTDTSNFRDRVIIEKKDTVFFSGQRKDSSKYCFPPSDKPICSDEYNSKDDYFKKSKLEIKHYTIRLDDRISSFSETMKEYVYLVASEIAIQEGFTKFIVSSLYYHGSCFNNYSANTRGSVYGNTYSATTYLNENKTCVGLMTIDVLLFNNYEEIKAGVFYQPSGYKSESVRPYDNLYLTPKELFKREPKYRDATINTPILAWKSYMDASETAKTLRQKHNVEPFLNYNITQSIKKEYKPSTLDGLEKTK